MMQQKLTQLIDYEGNFQPEVFEYVKDMKSRGFDYSVVTVLGAQSGGKSTLLNAMFNTSFEVLNAAKGRRQTTKGLWLATTEARDTLIVDVEGTDSKERGEDRHTFENRAALFCLALADVVIVNMWYNDLGRYTASNYGLLKTVLAVNLELFQQEVDAPKTVMMFVIRDYFESETPLEQLEQAMREDVRQIWSEIQKPPHMENSQAQDFFEFKTYGMPSKIAEPGKFDEKVEELRKRFYSECRPPAYSRKVPADGFAHYAQSIWQTILQSSELDIPTQKEMLATFRCEELKAAAHQEATKDLPKQFAAARDGQLESDAFRSWAQSALDCALEVYDGPASRYHHEVYLKVRQQLISSLTSAIQGVADAHLHSVSDAVAQAAEATLETSLEAAGDKRWVSFPEKVKEWREKELSEFDSKATSMSLSYSDPDSGESQVLSFRTDVVRGSLEKELDKLAKQQRDKESETLRKALRSLAGQRLAAADLESNLGSAELTKEKFWAAIHEQLWLAKRDAEERFRDSWESLHGGDADESGWDCVAYGAAVGVARERLERVCEWLQNHLVARFQTFFSHDDQGVPRQWQVMKAEGIKECFLQAKTRALELVGFLEGVEALPKLDDKVNMEEVRDQFRHLVSSERRDAMISRATRSMQQACKEAQLIQATGLRGANIPWWMWIVLLVLGYNEMTAVVFSPVMLVLVLVGSAVAGLAYLTGNFSLPMELARHGAAMLASTMLTLLKTLQGMANEPDAPAATSSSQQRRLHAE